MLDVGRRRSGLGPSLDRRRDGQGQGPRHGPHSGESAAKKDLWWSMLDSVASGRRLPEKKIFVLGGTPDAQRQFLGGLAPGPASSASASANAGGRRPASKRRAPIANQFALGYTYHDVLDADHEDILARLSVYLLSEPSPAFMRLLKPQLTAAALSASLVVILLDWAQPWTWLRQLRDWLRLVRALLASLDGDCQAAMQAVMRHWRGRSRGGSGNASGNAAVAGGGGAAGDAADGAAAGARPSSGREEDDDEEEEEEVTIPLGPGEWDEALGLPVCVVCQNAEHTERLEREHGWREEDFDFVLQTLRVVLLKHGASLIYTSGVTNTSASAHALQALIHASLGLPSPSPAKQSPALRHNVIDRDKVLVPANWDSWGKIRILRDGFDVDAVHRGWAADLDEGEGDGAAAATAVALATAVYEDTVHDPRRDAVPSPGGATATATATDDTKRAGAMAMEVETLETQEFLAGQLDVMERLRLEEEQQAKQQQQQLHPLLDSSSSPPPRTPAATSSDEGGAASAAADEARMTAHIGPVTTNMGGIRIDADDMLRRIKQRDGDRTSAAAPAASSSSSYGQLFTPTTTAASASPAAGAGHAANPKLAAPAAPSSSSSSSSAAAPGHASSAHGGSKAENEALASFFAGLMKRVDSQTDLENADGHGNGNGNGNGNESSL